MKHQNLKQLDLKPEADLLFILLLVVDLRANLGVMLVQPGHFLYF